MLDGRVVLITDTGSYVGWAAAQTIATAGARVVVNDTTNAGTVKAAADALARTIKRRGGHALPTYGDVSEFRDCVQIVQEGPNNWNWISGLVYVSRNDGADSLHTLLRAARTQMQQWGGAIVVVNADDDDIEVVESLAAELRAQRMTINAARYTDDDLGSMLVYLLSPEGQSTSGAVVPAVPDSTPEEIAQNIDAILKAAAAPAAADSAAPAAAPAATAKPAAKPAAKRTKPAAKAKRTKPAAKAKRTKPAAKAKRTKPAAKAKRTKPKS